MGSWGSVARGVVLLGGAVVLTVGCQSGGSAGDGSAKATTSTVAPVPSSYDPCAQVPQSALDQFQLDPALKTTAHNLAEDGTEWRGCGWGNPSWSVSVQVSNATFATIRAQHYQDVQSLTVAGRPAMSSRVVPEHPLKQCSVDVQIKGGTLDFFLSDSHAGAPGGPNACDLARQVAEAVIPTVPASVF